MTQMIKNVLVVSMFDVDVKRLFSMTRDVVIYRRNRFRESIVEHIMLIKRTEWFNEDRKTSLKISADTNTIERDELELTKQKLELTTHWATKRELSNDLYEVSFDQESVYNSEQFDISTRVDHNRIERDSRSSTRFNSLAVLKSALSHLSQHTNVVSSVITNRDRHSQLRVEVLVIQDRESLREYVLSQSSQRDIQKKRVEKSLEDAVKRSKRAWLKVHNYN